jgi:electron transfer flavoprotein beta subunit
VRILVAVKQVATLAEHVTFDGPTRVSPAAVSWQLNEWDRFSLETAVRLAEGCEASAGAEVVAVSVGDEHAEQGLRACLAAGADRALRVWDPQLEDADPLALASVLAAVAREERPDLILCAEPSPPTRRMRRPAWRSPACSTSRGSRSSARSSATASG